MRSIGSNSIAKGDGRMNTLQRGAIKNLIDWIGQHASIPENDNEIDPPHAHLDAFVHDWHRLSEAEIIVLISNLACPASARHTVFVCDIAEAMETSPQVPQSHKQVFDMSHAIGCPPSIYLPKRVCHDDDPKILRRELVTLRTGVFSARMSCVPWRSEGKNLVDVTIDYIQIQR
jgi:hypothetical protein